MKVNRWNYKKHDYDSINLPKTRIISCYESDMEKMVNCPNCGTLLPFGETYTSLGFGYGVCEKCHDEEHQREYNHRKEEEMKERIYGLANKSTCFKRKVGCIIVKNTEIIGEGYNKVIIDHESSKSCCTRGNIPSGTHFEICNALHAEQMAMSGVDIKDSEVFVSLFPCSICTKLLIQGGIKYLYYYEDYPGMEENYKLLRAYGVSIHKLEV